MSNEWTRYSKLWTVTITGADDSTSPFDMAALSQRFQCLEWAILCSNKMAGTPRFPSVGWTLGLMEVARQWWPTMRIAMHLCGSEAESFMRGEAWTAGATRVQVNGFDPDKSTKMLLPRLSDETILQCRSEDAILPTVQYIESMARIGRRSDRMSILFDVSGGRGVRPSRWPTPPDGVRMGYAGGIGPENVAEVIQEIGNVTPTWIDMESGVRTDNNLDMKKVSDVLNEVQAINLSLTEIYIRDGFGGLK